MTAADVMAVVTPFLVLAGVVYAARDRRASARELAVKVKDTADDLATKVDDQAAALTIRTEQIHVLVNSRLTEALERIDLLERRLGIEPGEDPP